MAAGALATAAELQQRYAEERSARMRQRAAMMLSQDMPDDNAPQGSIRERYQLSPAREVPSSTLPRRFLTPNCPRLEEAGLPPKRRAGGRGGGRG